MTSLSAPIPVSQREQDAIIHRVLKKRLDAIVPVAMREAGLDMWLILCQEDNHDPIFNTMIPMNTWAPILQMLIFFDRGEQGVERINLSMTDTQGLFDAPWKGTHFPEQWTMLRQIVEERDPKRIGINTGSVEWCAGGLTHNLYVQLTEALPEKYASRLESAEPAATRWCATLCDEEVELYEHNCAVAKGIIAECYSPKALVPGVTTTEDLVWHYRQRAADMGLGLSFRPFFNRRRSEAMQAKYGPDDPYLRAGDLVHCDVGITYLRLCSDHQQWAYIRRPGETDAPEEAYKTLEEMHRLQDVFMSEFREGLTGNEMLANTLSSARAQGIPNPRIYSHSLGLFLHEPGPLIGLPWEQERCEGRGDVALHDNYAFTMELSVTCPWPEWGKDGLRMSVEEDVVFTGGKCRLIGERQTRFHLV